MPENAQIDDDLFDKINEAMLIRLKDKIPNVRIQAVLALSRLQDPKDDDCPVVDGMYGFLNLISVCWLLIFQYLDLMCACIHVCVGVYNHMEARG